MLARCRGPDAAALVSSLHRRLTTALDPLDVLLIPSRGQELSTTPVLSENCGSSPGIGYDDTAARAKESRTMSQHERTCPVRVLMGFQYCVLAVVTDLAKNSQRNIHNVECKRTNGPGASTPMAGSAVVAFPGLDALEVILRTVIKMFMDIFVSGDATSTINLQKNSNVDIGADRAPEGRYADPGELFRVTDNDSDRAHVYQGTAVDQKDRNGDSPVVGGRAKTASPVRQLLALQLYLEVIRRWPRLVIILMRKVGVWDLLFSDSFLGGGSTLIARAIERLDHDSAAGATLVDTADSACTLRVFGDEISGNCTEDATAVGWGLVHDATLLLLEAVVVAGQLIQAGSAGRGRSGPGAGVDSDSVGQEGYRTVGVGVESLVNNEPVEVRKYLRFLTGGEKRQPSTIAAIQGCRWFTCTLAAEAKVSPVTLLHSSLRRGALRLAFRLCLRGQRDGSEPLGGGTVTWSLLHASMSLAVELVITDRVDECGSLLQTAVAFAEGVAFAEEADAATRLACFHRPTASLTSDASTHGQHALGTSWTAESAGSSTSASVKTESPIRATFSFGDMPLPLPQLPPPLTEVLFKAALDPRLRRAAFFMAAQLGVQAGLATLASTDTAGNCRLGGNQLEGEGACGGLDADESWVLRETAAEVLGELVEGYLCLCERAAVDITMESPADACEGADLLLEALRGACALIGTEASSDMTATTAQREGITASRGPRRLSIGESELSALLQEAFREHWASTRLLVVLERVVAGGTPYKRTPTQRSQAIPTCCEVAKTCLSFFTALMANNSLGKGAFRQALVCHQRRVVMSTTDASGPVPASIAAARSMDRGSFAVLADLLGVVPSESLLQTLVEMLMDGQDLGCIVSSMKAVESRSKDGDDDRRSCRFVQDDGAGVGEAAGATPPPEIRNPLVVPLVFRLLPRWPESEQRQAMQAFSFLLGETAGGGMVNRSMCCDVQPSLTDQVCVWVQEEEFLVHGLQPVAR